MKRPAVVVGGASGIGLAVAERLLGEGWPVAIIDDDAEALSEAEERLGGDEIIFIRADATDDEEMAEAFDRCVDAFGPLVAQINAICAPDAAGFAEVTAELLREVLETNLVAVLISCRAGVERRADNLSLVNVVETASDGLAFWVAHQAVALMSVRMAAELGTDRVRVNCVAWPGASGATVSPLRRPVELEEVAAAVAYLVSDEAAHVTGQTIALGSATG